MEKNIILVCGMVPPGGDIPEPMYLMAGDELEMTASLWNSNDKNKRALVTHTQTFRAAVPVTIEFEHMRIKQGNQTGKLFTKLLGR